MMSYPGWLARGTVSLFNGLCSVIIAKTTLEISAAKNDEKNGGKFPNACE